MEHALLEIIAKRTGRDPVEIRDEVVLLARAEHAFNPAFDEPTKTDRAKYYVMLLNDPSEYARKLEHRREFIERLKMARPAA